MNCLKRANCPLPQNLVPQAMSETPKLDKASKFAEHWRHVSAVDKIADAIKELNIDLEDAVTLLEAIVKASDGDVCTTVDDALGALKYDLKKQDEHEFQQQRG